jgi:hypothetical protein
LVESADWAYLQRQDGRVTAEVKKIIGFFGR